MVHPLIWVGGLLITGLAGLGLKKRMEQEQPLIKLPDVDLPDINIPEFKIPEFPKIPEVHLQMPTISLPSVKFPKLDIDLSGIGEALSGLKPDLKMPEFKMPEIPQLIQLPKTKTETGLNTNTLLILGALGLIGYGMVAK